MSDGCNGVRSGSFVPYKHQYHSDATPNKLLKRILNAGFEINCGDVI